MFIDLTSEQRKLRDDLRAYFADLVTPEEAAEMSVNRHGDAYRAVVRRMGRDGWLGVGWPKEYGGQGFGPVEQQIFYNEASRADVPLPLVTLLTVGPTLQQFGTQEQKEKFLPGILSGDIHFAIGYSEPEAGTDLAALRTSAVKDDSGDWVVNGQKIFTTGAHEADYIWLACRTGSVESRHRGITILIADTTDPGYSWTPIITADGAHHTNATYFDDVRVPASMLVGEENKGWRLITTQLNHERVSLGPSGKIEQLYDKVRDWARPRAVLDEPEAQRALGRIHAMTRLNELLNWQVAATAEDPGTDQSQVIADASATKIFSTESLQEAGRLAEEIVGRFGDPADPATAELLGWLDRRTKQNLVVTFGGGVNEVMRELVASAGLKLPRVPR